MFELLKNKFVMQLPHPKPSFTRYAHDTDGAFACLNHIGEIFDPTSMQKFVPFLAIKRFPQHMTEILVSDLLRLQSSFEVSLSEVRKLPAPSGATNVDQCFCLGLIHDFAEFIPASVAVANGVHRVNV